MTCKNVAILFFVLAVGVIAKKESSQGEIKFEKLKDGYPAKLNEFPHNAAILKNGAFHCNAAILTSRYIISTAACVDNLDGYTITVRTGSNDYANGGNVYEMEQAFPYKDAGQIGSKPEGADYKYNIGLIKLKTPIKLGLAQRVVSLEDQPPTEKISGEGTVSGWGSYGTNEDSTVLQKLSVVMDAKDYCDDVPNFEPDIHHICTYLPSTGRGKQQCAGGDGSPLIYESRLRGIAVGKVKCGTGAPAIFLSTYYLKNFIEERLKEDIVAQEECD
ncbi:trypsin 3A1-like [Prorops nasuta]|uniref:trypsin 3A1-like n=1 Tax=Prorops nasuta TaxID=863751 RepID=UPI0034CFA08E